MAIMAGRRQDADTTMNICARYVRRKTARKPAGMCMTVIRIAAMIMWTGIATVPVMQSESARQRTVRRQDIMSMTGRVTVVMTMRVGIVTVPATALKSVLWKAVRRQAGIRMTERLTVGMRTAADIVIIPVCRQRIRVRSQEDAEDITDIIPTGNEPDIVSAWVSDGAV